MSNSWKTIMFWERPFFWFTLYVSWNCNQTFITEKLNAYSRSSSTRGEGPSLASKSVEEIVFSVLLLLRASYRKICGVFIAFTHIWLWSQTGDWRYEYEYTDTSYTLISWCGGAFSIYINTSDFPDPDLSRAELNNSIPHILVLMDCSLSSICVQATACDPGRATQLSRERSRPAQHLPHHPHTFWHVAACHWRPCLTH